MGEPPFYEWRYSGIAGIRAYLVTSKKSDLGRFTHMSFLLALFTETEWRGKGRMAGASKLREYVGFLVSPIRLT